MGRTARRILWLLLLAAVAATARAAAAAPAHMGPRAAAVAAGARGVSSGTKVRVEFFGEGLCPYCIAFAREKLSALFSNGLGAIVELDYIPSGNARMGDDGSITCQHGPKECELNRVTACALALAPNQADWFPFVLCIDDKAQEGDPRGLDVEEAAAKCAIRAGISSARLLACYKSELGGYLERRAFERTDSLVPPHKWVPWVLVNGVPLFDDVDNVATFVCAAYNGYPKPAYCFHPPPPDPSTQQAFKWTARFLPAPDHGGGSGPTAAGAGSVAAPQSRQQS